MRPLQRLLVRWFPYISSTAGLLIAGAVICAPDRPNDPLGSRGDYARVQADGIAGIISEILKQGPISADEARRQAQASQRYLVERAHNPEACDGAIGEAVSALAVAADLKMARGGDDPYMDDIRRRAEAFLANAFLKNTCPLVYYTP